VKTTLKTGATITGLQPGAYQATVVPVNFKQQTGRAATVTFTVP
jgi:predicted phage tail protein